MSSDPSSTMMKRLNKRMTDMEAKLAEESKLRMGLEAKLAEERRMREELGEP